LWDRTLIYWRRKIRTELIELRRSWKTAKTAVLAVLFMEVVP